MALRLFQTARNGRAATGTGRETAGQPDRSFPDPSPRSRIVLGSLDRHCPVRRPDAAAVALRFDAHPESEVNDTTEAATRSE